MQSMKFNKRARHNIPAVFLTILVSLAIGLSACSGAAVVPVVSGALSESVAGSPTAVTPQTAALVNLRGWVEVQPVGGAWSPAQAGQTLTAGDRVRTGSLSSAGLSFADGSQAVLRASAELSIDLLDAPTGSVRTIVLTQWSGESDHQVATNKRPGSRYAVQTATGTGEAKGTQFHVSASETTARFAVTEGVVAVSGQDATVLVDAGEVTTVTADEPPLEPVVSVTAQGLVAQTGPTWLIAGQAYTVTAETVLVGDPQLGDWVFVEGRQETGGTRLAERIVLLADAVESHFSLSGTVETQSETGWTINGQTIVLTDTTQLDADIVPGETVNVEGLVLPGGGLQAESILRASEAPGLPFDFTGVVQEMTAESWVVSGLALSVSLETSFSEALLAGELVRVQGWALPDGTWQAASITRVEPLTTPFEFTGVIESLDPWQVGGIAFQTGEWTQVDADLQPGDRVRVSGEVSPEGTWLAGRVELLQEVQNPLMVVVGPVVSLAPLVVNGIPLSTAEGAVLAPEIVVGSLVQVTAQLQPDGAWQMVEILLMQDPAEVPPCVQVTAPVTTLDGGQIQIEGWPALALEETTVVTGELIAGATVQAEICFDASFQIHLTQVQVVTDEDPDDPEDPQDGDDDDEDEDEDTDDDGDAQEKVDVCHKPNKKKGGHTINIALPALPAHLAHGDTEGACK